MASYSSSSSAIGSASSSSLAPSSSSTPIFSSSSSFFSSSSAPPPSSSSLPFTTTTTSLSTVPPTTIFSTSIVTAPPAPDQTTPLTSTLVLTSTAPGTTIPVPVTATGNSLVPVPSDSSSTDHGAGATSSSHGLSKAGTIAVAVVVPVAVITLLALAGLFFWRRRKQRKDAEEARRKEVEDYGFNPNNDPTLPTVSSDAGHEMSEAGTSGYRGWGVATASNRKMSTTLSGGHTQGQLSESSSNAYRNPGSPTGQYSDGHSVDPLVSQRDTMNSDEIGALGQAPPAASNQGPRRGPSNASSTYSHGGRNSDEELRATPDQAYEYTSAQNYGYGQHGPYGDGTYGGGQDNPVVRDLSARRNNRIQQPGGYQQGNSGISQNF